MGRIKRRPLYIALDTETYRFTETGPEIDKRTKKPKLHKVVSAYLCGWCTSEEPNKLCFSTGKHLEFINFLTKKYEEGYQLKGYVFNANYDMPVLLKDILNTLPGAKVNYRNSEKGKFINFSYSCDYFKFTVEDAALWDAQISTLAEWLKLLGLPEKIENFDYDKNGPLKIEGDDILYYNSEGHLMVSSLKEELKYLERDVLGLLQVVRYQRKVKLNICQEFQIRPYKSFIPGTAPSFSTYAIDLYMKQHKGIKDYFDTTFRPEIPNDLYEIYNNMEVSSIGGFTAFNKEKLKIVCNDEKIYCFDVNSMYPANMVTGLPIGELLTKKPRFKEYVTWLEVHLTTVQWIEIYKYISTSPLPQTWCSYEGNTYLLKELYDVLKDKIESDLIILDTLYQVKDYSLTEFLLLVYGKKLEAENIKDIIVRKQVKSGCKILMNGLYGKSCQKVFKDEKFYNLDWEGFDVRKSRQKDGSLYPFRSLMAGIYICQMSRTKLLQTLFNEIEKGNEFLYCDTDSILMIFNNSPSFDTHPSKLGAWKCEGCGPDELRGFTHFFSLGVKKKKFLTNKNLIVSGGDIGKLTLSGVSNSVQKLLIRFLTLKQMEFIFDNKNNIMIKGGKIQKHRNKYGQTVLINTDIKINAKCTKEGHFLDITHELEIDKENKKVLIKKYSL